MSLSRYNVSSMGKYDKEITKLSTSITLLQCRRTFRSIPIFLSWKGKLAASTKVKIIPTPLLHSLCSAAPPPPPPQKLRASYGLACPVLSSPRIAFKSRNPCIALILLFFPAPMHFIYIFPFRIR